MSLRILLFTAATALSTAPALAQDETIQIEDAYARVSPSGSGAVFMTIHNMSDQDDRLTGASVAEDIAERAELHTHADTDGVMRMIEVKEGFAVPAGGSAQLRRGGDHVMLMGLKQGLKNGDTFPLILIFEHAPKAEIVVTIDNIRNPEQRETHEHSGHR